jgi:hypothetical protein
MWKSLEKTLIFDTVKTTNSGGTFLRTDYFFFRNSGHNSTAVSDVAAYIAGNWPSYILASVI